jgi:hypothetical protein
MSVLASVTAFAHTAENPFVTDLIAGGGNEASAMDVGDVRVWNDGDDLYVKYEVADEGWCITDTHLEVATSLENIPQNNGNPKPGHFTYKNEHDCVPGVEYQIPLSWGLGTPLSIAAHAVVQTGGLDGLGTALPDQVTMVATRSSPGFGAPSYFDVAISGGTTLDGMYDGHCVDGDHSIQRGDVYQANVYSSYEDFPLGLVEYPENLDLINYIINQRYVGNPSPSGGTYSLWEVQRAIWALIEDECNCWTEPYSQEHVGEIVADALANGEGFVPGCGDVMAVILEPLWEVQILIIEVPMPCVQDETAWGDGLDFPGENWATYFEYSVQ